MGDKTEQDKQRATDSQELGYVNNVNDLAPDNKVGKSRQETATRRIDKGNASGYFEGQGGGLAEPLHIGPELRKDAGPALDRYVDGYSIYAVPLHSTLGSMGRLKDVSLTGAPMTPAELMQRPEFASRFTKLTSENATADQEIAAGAWSKSQQELAVEAADFSAAQVAVAAAVELYRSVQYSLQRKRVEAQRAEDHKQVRELEETADTLAKIVDVTMEAATSFGEFGELLEAKVALNETAEGLGTIEHLPTSGATNWEHGTIHDPTGEGAATKSKVKRAGDGMSGASELGSRASQLAHQAKTRLAKVGAIELTMRGVFIALLDPAKYAQLNRDIVKLDAKIQALSLKEEQSRLIAAEKG